MDGTAGDGAAEREPSWTHDEAGEDPLSRGRRGKLVDQAVSVLAAALLLALYPTELSRSQPRVAPGGSDSALRAATSGLLALPTHRLAGEFEPQSAVLISAREFTTAYPEILQQFVHHVEGRIPICVLVGDGPDGLDVDELDRVLGEEFRQQPDVTLLEIPHDTLWIRDYGPIITVDPRGDPQFVDPDYDEPHRPSDDAVPELLAWRLGSWARSMPLTIEGGNLLSNGEGLCLTTEQVIEANAERGYLEGDVREVLREYCGCEDTFFLEPLVGEDTGHVDMFATFTSVDTVLVGQYDRELDTENAELLERNAEKLSSVRTSLGPLRVLRIPMPPHEEDIWRTYTNVVFANGVLLVPTYSGTDPMGGEQAVRIYRSLMPSWTVVAIESEDLAESGGALHCVSRNLPAVPSAGVRDWLCPAPLALDEALCQQPY